jgi:putative copper export protein
VRPSSFTDPEWLATPFGRTIVLKLLLFAVVLGISIAHDFHVGPAATAAMRKDPGGPEAVRLRRMASWMGRVNTVLALALVFLGVVLVRGWP